MRGRLPSPLRVVTDLNSALDILRKVSQVQNENRAAFYRVPTETDAELEATLDLYDRIKTMCPGAIVNGLFIFVPFPGAPLSDYIVALKREYPDHDAASVLMEAQIPYDYLIQVMDIVRSVELPVEDAVAGEPEYELYALFSEISVGDAP